MPGSARSRITTARGYHPRGRTVGESAADPSGGVPDRTGVSARAGAVRARTVSTTDQPDRAAPVKRSTPTDRPRVATGRPRSARAYDRRAPDDQRRPDDRRASDDRRAPDDRRSAYDRRGRLVRSVQAPARLGDPRRRLRIATALIVVLFTVIAGRLVEIQVNDGAAYAAKGLDLRLRKVTQPAPRGAIVDRNGAVLASSAEARLVYADPGLVKDPTATADALTPILGVPRSELLPKLVPHRRDDGVTVRFEYLARGVDVPTADAVRALKLPGIVVDRDERRVVPGHDLAANLVGFTGRDLTGLSGVEASYDEVLRGVDGTRTFEAGQPDGDGNLDHEIPTGYQKVVAARPGSSVRLTIDRDLQFEVQRQLGVRARQVKADYAAAVVLDVRTGEVLAQASYPFYDAANPFAYPQLDRGDVATGLTVDPGSVHKAIVMAACLQEGVVASDAIVRVTPKIVKGDTTYTDVHYHNKPVDMTLPGILAYSSNVGTITLADRLGAENLYRYQRLFGLGESTGEGLPGESAGLVQPPANWSGSSYGSIPIGMGVSVTPLQMAAVYAAIANGGRWVRPHLVQAVVAPDGTARPVDPAPTRQVISAEHAAAVRSMLEAVVAVPDATGVSAAVDGYRVAGKTGTGKMVRDGHYVGGEVASFVGMAPADAPRYVIAVFAHTPGGNGATMGPLFAKLMMYTLRHFRVAPTGTKPPTFRVYR